MVQRSENMEVELKDQLRGGKGTVEITHLLKQDQLKGKCRLVGSILIKPGCSIGLHCHDNEEEIYYVIKGEGTVDDNGERKLIKTGDAMLTGNGASHSVENTGNEDMVILAVILLY